MPDEDKAIQLLQSINKEILSTLTTIKEKRNDSNTMDSATTAKLEEIQGQMKQVQTHILTFMNRYNKQTSLNDYNRG
tara:strand:+ start:6526 stop:6756 length:231 start_codon:yes stop_codon:yes gene_type:complete